MRRRAKPSTNGKPIQPAPGPSPALLAAVQKLLMAALLLGEEFSVEPSGYDKEPWHAILGGEIGGGPDPFAAVEDLAKKVRA